MFRLRNLAPQIAALVLGASASAGSLAQTTLKFGEGAGEVTVPAHYAQVEDRDASLVVLSQPEGNVKLYFDLHKLDAAIHVANPGEVMVREQAQKNGKQLKQHAGKVLFFDPSPPTKVGEEVIFNFHWQVGFGKTMVVMTARVPYAAREAPDVKRFMAVDMNTIVASLRRVGG